MSAIQSPPTAELAHSLVQKVLGWASKLSAEERSLDEGYSPPTPIVNLVKKLRDGSRAFYVLSGLWGVGKSSALQYIASQLNPAEQEA